MKSVRKPLVEYVKDLSGRTIEYVSGYISMSVKCTHRCLSCAFEWESRPSNVRSGSGCPECSKARVACKNALKESDVIEKLGCKGLTYLGGYISASHPCKVSCNVCGHLWNAKAGNVLYNTGCPKCAGKAQTEASYAEALAGRNIRYVSGYRRMREACLHRCLVDGFEWEASPSNIKRGAGCPKCAPYGFQQDKMALLYFLISAEGFMKIGITGANDKRRISKLKRCTPFSLYGSACMPGKEARKREKEMHDALESDSARLSGFDGCTEWFKATRHVLETVNRALSEANDDSQQPPDIADS